MRWLLLRGLTRDARHWGDFPDVFARAIDAEEVRALDLPGNGALHAQPSPADIAGMVAACRRELGLGEEGALPPFGIVALSLGAMVATAWAAAHPEEIVGVVLVNTSMRPFCPFPQRLRPHNYGTLLRLLCSGSDISVERTILKLTSNRHAADGELLARWADWRGRCPVSWRNALRQLWAAARFHAPPSPPVPVLLLAGAGDRLVDHRCSLRLAERWHCALALHPSAGHDLPLDEPQWVAAAVADWLAAAVSAQRP